MGRSLKSQYPTPGYRLSANCVGDMVTMITNAVRISSRVQFGGGRAPGLEVDQLEEGANQGGMKQSVTRIRWKKGKLGEVTGESSTRQDVAEEGSIHPITQIQEATSVSEDRELDTKEEQKGLEKPNDYMGEESTASQNHLDQSGALDSLVVMASGLGQESRSQGQSQKATSPLIEYQGDSDSGNMGMPPVRIKAQDKSKVHVEAEEPFFLVTRRKSGRKASRQ